MHDLHRPAAVVVLALVARREVDLLAVGEDTPCVVGVGMERVRLTGLLGAAVLTRSASHAARGLVGGRSARVVPVAVLIEAAPLASADAAGRTVVAAELSAGLVVRAVRRASVPRALPRAGLHHQDR